jgi:hypothetical protein
MLEPFRRLLLRPIARAWLASSAESWHTLPRPQGTTIARADGSNPDRLLLIGSGISVGYGTTSHDFALAGQLARELSGRTGRGAEVDVLVTEDMSARDVRRVLNRKLMLRVDSIVATLGGMETLFMHSARAWRRETESLLDYIHEHAPASLQVFVVAVPDLPSIVRMPRLIGLLAARSALRINAQLELACAGRANATFVPFEPDEFAGRTGTGRTYQRWAEMIAPLVSASLDPHALLPRQ